MVTLSLWVQAWIERRSIRLRPSTLSGYRGNLHRYIVPSPVGDMALDQLTPDALIVLLSPILAKGFTRQAQIVQIMLGAALRDAVRQRVIPWSPMDCVDRIQHRSTVTAWWSVEDARRFLQSARNAHDPYYVAWILGLCCGLRRGELLGLRWEDIDLKTGVLHVRRQRVRVDRQVLETPPKSITSIRDIPLADPVRDQLRFLRGVGYVVGGTDEELRRALEAAIRKAGVPRITLHGLRHTMAATAASEGIPIKILQVILGHAQFTTTADIYAHVDRKAVEVASCRIAARLEIV